jgi:short subunit dehydrogenase-like uncharacterized protein
MHSLQWMIYGANGFSGSLIAREAVRKKLKPILAGRNGTAITDLAKELNLEYRIFALDEPKKLEGIKLLLNCAGSFKATAQILAESCITSGVHYLDISGELFTFQTLFELSNSAKEKHIILLPGVGFFITATDCLLSLLKKELPDAELIDLFFVVDSQFRFNSGSIKSIFELLNETYINMGQEKGEAFISHTHKKATINNQEINMISLPLPDLFTGKISTGISNIRIYGYFRSFSLLFDKVPWFLSNSIIFMFRFPIIIAIMAFAYNFINRLPHSIVDINQMNSGVLLHGIAYNNDAMLIQKAIEIGNPYIFTQKSTLLAIQRILEKPYFIYSGFQTPSLAFGENFLLEILENMD